MNIRLAGFFLVLITAGVVSSAQQSPQTRSALKQRMHDVPTPGRLNGLRTTPATRLTIDATGTSFAVANPWEIDSATGAHYRRGEVLVRFRANTDTGSRTRALRSARGTHITRVLPANWNLVALEPGADAAQSVRALRSRPEVQAASLNYRRAPQQVRPNDEFHHLQWNFNAINMPLAWEINPGARNDVIVAVLDTGLNTTTDTFVFSTPFIGQIPLRFAAVPDLVTDLRIVAARDFIFDDAFPIDLDGHGTHVTGTIAQQTNNGIGVAGVAYNVRLMPLKVITGGPESWDDILNPGNPGGTDALVAEAIRHAADNGAQVINLSLGGPGEAPVLLDAISYAVSRGAFVAIAVGNSAEDGNPEEFPAAYGAEINGAMAVGAVNRDLRRAVYSGFHPYVEICAPGGEMTSEFDFEQGVTQIAYEDGATLSFLTGPEKMLALVLGFRPRFDAFEPVPFNGTSMAAPHVSGVAALLYSQGIRSPAAIEEAIKRLARPIDATADECGAGLVDARRALRGLGLAR